MQPLANPILRTGASQRGGVLGYAGVVDVPALSLAARRHTIRIPLPALVQNATTNHSLGPIGMLGTIVGAFISYRIPPVIAGGTATYQIGRRVSGGSQTLFTTSANLLALVANTVATPPGLTTTDVNPTDLIEFQAVVSNNAVTQGTDGFLTLVFDPTDPATLSQ